MSIYRSWIREANVQHAIRELEQLDDHSLKVSAFSAVQSKPKCVPTEIMLASFIARKLLRTGRIPQHPKTQQTVPALPDRVGSQVEWMGGQRSSLVLRLIRAQGDPAKQRLRGYLLAQTDDRLRDSLGLTAEDISALRRHRRLIVVRRA